MNKTEEEEGEQMRDRERDRYFVTENPFKAIRFTCSHTLLSFNQLADISIHHYWNKRKARVGILGNIEISRCKK